MAGTKIPFTTATKSATRLYDENGVAYGVKHVNNKPRVSAMPYLYDIAEGNVSGHEGWSKIGYNGDVDVGIEDMWTVGGEYVFPTAAMQMEVISSSADDDSGGTGVNSVTLYYLDASGAEKTEDITLNGTTAVATTATDIYRVQRLRALTCGTGGRAAGNIDVRHLSDTPIYGRILAGQTRGKSCVWTVPTGKTLYVTSVSVSIGGTANAKSARFTTVANYDSAAGVMRDFFIGYNEVVLIDDNFYRPLEIPTKLIAGTDLKIRVEGYVANCICACSLRGWLEDA